MFDKIKEKFKFDKDKKIENLFSFLIILVITLIIINKIISDKEEPRNYENEVDVELAKEKEELLENNLERRLENILETFDGIEKVKVLLTYSESSSMVPIYNESIQKSTITEENKINTTENLKKDVVYNDNSKDIVKEKTIEPKIEGALVSVKCNNSVEIKSNIISAVEAVTGLAPHKIQVFEMGE